MPLKFNLNSRTIAAPLAAFCMASILFVYARTSIRAAKRNAQSHRDADGGQISWRNESLRRHGALAPPEEQGTVTQLLKSSKGSGKETGVREVARGGEGRTVEEERIRALTKNGKRGEGG